MTSEPHTDLMNAAYTLGEQHGAAAGSWVIDGNTKRDAAQAILTGYEDGDPLVMDMQPAPLSGEWADGMTPQELIHELTDGAGEYDLHADHPLYDAACDAYEQGFSDGYWAEVISAAQNVVA